MMMKDDDAERFSMFFHLCESYEVCSYRLAMNFFVVEGYWENIRKTRWGHKEKEKGRVSTRFNFHKGKARERGKSSFLLFALKALLG